MIKLIALDLDGTLLNSKGEISLANELTLKKCYQSGIKIVLASGRQIFSLTKFLKQLDLEKDNQYSISSNGGIIFENKNKTILKKLTISGADIKKAFALSKKIGTSFFAYTLDQKVLYENLDEYVQFEIDLVGAESVQRTISNIDDKEEFLKMTFTSSKEKLDEVVSLIDEAFLTSHNVVRSHNAFDEVLPKNSSKGNALVELCHHLNIPTDEVMTFGDNLNDYDLVKNVKYGIAMANSPSKELKRIAYDIALTNDEDGVAKMINKYIKLN